MAPGGATGATSDPASQAVRAPPGPRASYCLALLLLLPPALCSSPSSLHLAADTPTGTIVKRFPALPGLRLLPSRDSDLFYLLNSGELMVARPLGCLQGGNLSLALAHQEVQGPTDFHLLSLHLHARGDYLEFEQAQYVYSVMENQASNQEVGVARLLGGHATNLQVSLHPAKWRDLLLAVPSYTNNTAQVSLRTLRPLDREQNARIQLRLVATNPESLESASTRVDVFVKNVNDNAPVFKQRIYNMRTPIGTRRFSVIGKVEASDGDGDSLVYQLARQSGPFVVVPQTGEVLVTEEPQLSMYLLQVVARDAGRPALTSKPALVYVSFERPEPELVNVTEAHSRTKRRVTRAVRPTKRTEFTEADGEPEGKIVFQLEKESEHETFKIREENPWVTVEPNGAVRVKKKWDYEELGREKTIDFWVIITNSGSGGEYRGEEREDRGTSD